MVSRKSVININILYQQQATRSFHKPDLEMTEATSPPGLKLHAEPANLPSDQTQKGSSRDLASDRVHTILGSYFRSPVFIILTCRRS
jgi:hypothetical protein